MEAGGKVVSVLDCNTTYVVSTETWALTEEWIKGHCGCDVVDGKVMFYDATVHSMEWLYEANRRKQVMSSDFKRLMAPTTEQSLEGGKPLQVQGAVLSNVDVSSTGRETPPCYCGNPCLVKVAASVGSINKGRQFFVCAKELRANACRFFEWADEPPRPQNYDHFTRHGYAFERVAAAEDDGDGDKKKRARSVQDKSAATKKTEQQPRQPAPSKKRVKLESQVLSSTQRDIEYAMDDADILDVLKCPICVSPFIDPRTAVCGHSFCQVCVLKYIEATSRNAAQTVPCPNCRAPIGLDSLRDPDATLIPFLDDLLVHCACKREGCPWVGRRGEMAAHEAECSYVVALSVQSAKAPVQYAENGLLIVNDRERVEINDPSRLGPARAPNVTPTVGEDEEKDSMELCDSSDGGDAKKHNSDPRPIYSVYSPPGSDEDVDADQFEYNTADTRAYIEPAAAASTLKPWITSRRAAWAVGKAALANAMEQQEASSINQALVDELKKLASRYENLGDKWRARGHNLAAGTIVRVPFKITSVDQVRHLPNIGERIAKKIGQFLAFGEVSKNRVVDPDTVAKAEMGKVHGVGAACVEKFWVQGIRSLEQMRQHPELLTPQQTIGLKYVDEFQLRIPREEVDEFKKIFDQTAYDIDPELILEICGSYRRGKQTCGDIDVLVTHRRFDKPLAGVLDKLVAGLTKRGILTDALTPESVDDKWMGVGQLRPDLPHRRVDFQIIARPSWACALLYFTGSAHFNRSMRHYAGRNGFSLSQHALVVRNTPKHEKDMHKKGVPVKCMTEEDVFIALGLQYVPPHQRDM